MPATLDDLIGLLQRSRDHFYKHLNGLNEDQWDFKPYSECMSIRETLQHLVVDDRTALESIKTGEEPDYEAHACDETDIARLRQILKESHQALLNEIKSRYANSPLDADVCIWGRHDKLIGIPYFSSEDFYHTGQVSFIRMASDPSWNYYETIYGGE